jgi:lipopolysaccharide transport system ATP-binding protein
MSDIAIEVRNVSKSYRIGSLQQGDQRFGYKSLRDAVNDVVTAPLRRARRLLRGAEAVTADVSETIWALDDVSFAVKQGEVVGIIGRNGAGKSTLLKILSRITEPTSGCVELRGRIGSLLEVGTGFHPELTGRENIYLNGAILGMKRSEIKQKFDEIVAFAEIEQFIDTPVKHYSSGMYMRLAFAVAANLESEILLVDEVLAVGDALFQKKCLGKMNEVAHAGRTVLLVSHNMGSIGDLCTSAISLQQGQLVYHGTVHEVIRHYLAMTVPQAATIAIQPPAEALPICLQQATIVDPERGATTQIPYHKTFQIKIGFEMQQAHPELSIWIRLKNQLGVYVAGLWLCYQHPYQVGNYSVTCDVPGALLTPGLYYLDIGSTHYRVKRYHCAFDCLSFEIINSDPAFDENDKDWGVIYPQWPCTIQPVSG